MPPACFCLAESQRGSAIAPPLLKNLQIAEGSNQVLKGLQISMAPAQRSKQLAPIWCCMAQEKGCSASQLQRGFNGFNGAWRHGYGSWHPGTLLQTHSNTKNSTVGPRWTKGPLFPSEESSDKEERFPRTWVQWVQNYGKHSHLWFFMENG